jgi:proteic killer suppression protein
VIRSFADPETQHLWETGKSRRKPPPNVRRVALRKLVMLDSAKALMDLRVPPGNRLEELKGDRRGQHSIRINDQYRICFVWKDGDAFDVEITDYH